MPKLRNPLEEPRTNSGCGTTIFIVFMLIVIALAANASGIINLDAIYLR